MTILIGHIKSIHEKKRSFECSFCFTRFSNKGNMYKHITAIHEGEKPIKSKCIICDKSFFNKYTAIRHVKSKHGSIEIGENAVADLGE